MANTLMNLLVTLGLDSAALDKGLTKAESSAGKSMQAIGKGMTKAGTIMTAGLTLPIIAGFGAALKSGAQFSDSLEKMTVLFGGNAGQVRTWSETAARSIGVTQQKAMEAAGTYKNLFDAMGVGATQATDMSMSMVQLAGDMAEFNSADPSAVMDALVNAMAGRGMALKQYGVNLDAAAVSQLAISNGWVDEAGKVTEAGTAMASYMIIMEQTTRQQGTFANSVGDAGAEMAKIKAEMGDAAAKLGAALIPALLKVTPILLGLVDKFNSLSPAMMTTIVAVLGMVAATGPLLIIAGKLITAVGAISGALTTLTAATGIAGAAFVVTVAPILAVVAVMAALVVGSFALFSAWEKGSTAFQNYKSDMDMFGESLWYVEDAVVETGQAVDTTAKQIEIGKLATEHWTAWLQGQTIPTLTETTTEITETTTAMADLGEQYSAVSSLGQMFTTQTQDMDAALQNAKLAQEGYDAALLSGEGIEAATTNLGEAQTAVEALQTAQDLQTASWMLNCLTQALGVDGINAADMAFLLQYQVDTDLISADAAVRAQAQWDMAQEMIAGYNAATDAANGITGALGSIPTHVTSTVDIITNQTTNWFNVEHGVTSGRSGVAVQQYTPQAEGGDYWVQSPTLFLAGEAGLERATFTPADSAGSSATQPILNEAKLARLIRDAFLQVVK